MHQHPRPSPVTASPASSPRTNPTRTNNPRDAGQSARPRTTVDVPGYTEGEEGGEDAGGAAAAGAGPSRDAVKKLDQIIQNFHTKAAIVVLQSRMSLPVILTKDGPKRVNKWFQIETDDTPAFRDDLSVWRNCGGLQNRPPPLILETYLDTSALESNHSLVIVDDNGRRSNVLDALNNSSGSSDGDSRRRKRNTEVILERWKVELKENAGEVAYDFAATLPTIYKKCIVFFRSLYSTSKFTPAWRFVKSLAKSDPPTDLLRVKCRVLSGDVPSGRFDALTHPLYEDGGAVTTNYFLGTTDTPVGQITAEVSYRNDCNFRVDDADGVLGSRYMGANDQYFQPSLAAAHHDGRRSSSRAVEVGSLPTHRQPSIDDHDPIQAYGSLSTFHGDIPPRASSPMSALRAAKIMGSDANSPPVSSSLPRTRPIQTSRGSLVSLEGVPTARRPSVSFQPFKAGSLSSSPGRGTPLQSAGDIPPQSPHSLPRSMGINPLYQARNRSSLTAGMPASLRGGPPVLDNVAASGSSSPKPAPMSKYSSSFTHRRSKSSFGGASKIADDDQVSSGKQSLSSSIQPGSGILAEGAGTSSGSLHTDDDNISEFLKLLDSKKTLQSFERSGEASNKRTSAQLSKFQSMRESNNALTESMSSSTLLHRSSSSSSRQLSSVPPMVAATSMSASSSPGKPISPHTPHTPAIPSRLSANSVAEYSVPRRPSLRHRPTPESQLEDVGDADQTNEGTNAINIPTSPRPYYHHHARRSSSVAQQHRALPIDDDLGELPFGAHRSISLGADDREPPSLSALLKLGQEEPENVVSTSSPSSPRLLQPAPHISESSGAMARQQSSSADANDLSVPQGARAVSAGSINATHRPKLGRTGGRGMTPPQSGSYSSLIDRAGTSTTSERGSGRYSFTRTAGTYEVDDEPLLFDMSEIGREQSRRSIEETRGGSGAGVSGADRGVYDAARGGDSGLSSRRGGGRRGGW